MPSGAGLVPMEFIQPVGVVLNKLLFSSSFFGASSDRLPSSSSKSSYWSASSSLGCSLASSSRGVNATEPVLTISDLILTFCPSTSLISAAYMPVLSIFFRSLSICLKIFCSSALRFTFLRLIFFPLFNFGLFPDLDFGGILVCFYFQKKKK